MCIRDRLGVLAQEIGDLEGTAGKHRGPAGSEELLRGRIIDAREVRREVILDLVELGQRADEAGIGEIGLAGQHVLLELLSLIHI